MIFALHCVGVTWAFFQQLLLLGIIKYDSGHCVKHKETAVLMLQPLHLWVFTELVQLIYQRVMPLWKLICSHFIFKKGDFSAYFSLYQDGNFLIGITSFQCSNFLTKGQMCAAARISLTITLNPCGVLNYSATLFLVLGCHLDKENLE